MHKWLLGECVIFHVDVNSAFLSWSALKKLKTEPGSIDLRTVPSAVGGDMKTRHGVITAKSIPAKKYGVKTGEPVASALGKCPGLILVPSDFTWYRECSGKLMNILRQYSSKVEQASIDEAYLDVTEHMLDERGEPDDSFSAEELAHSIRRRVFEELEFTVNVGISTNKLLAKMASDFQKPDKVHTLFPEEVPSKMWPLPMGELYGCGAATAEKLRSFGVRTIGDAAKSDISTLKSILGEKAGEYIYRSACGRGSDQVKVQREKAKSYSNETTTTTDITEDNYKSEGLPIIRHLCKKVAGRMQKAGVYAYTVTVSVKTAGFARHSRQETLPDPVNDEERIYASAIRLLDALLMKENGLFKRGEKLRLIGVGGSSLTDGAIRQLSLFDWAQGALAPEEESGEEPKESAQVEVSRRKETGGVNLAAEAHAREGTAGTGAEARDSGEPAGAGTEEEVRGRKEPAEEGTQAEDRGRRAGEKKERLEKMMRSVSARYGENALRKGALQRKDQKKDQESSS